MCPANHFLSKLKYHFSVPGRNSEDNESPLAANPFNDNLQQTEQILRARGGRVPVEQRFRPPRLRPLDQTANQAAEVEVLKHRRELKTPANAQFLPGGARGNVDVVSREDLYAENVKVHLLTLHDAFDFSLLNEIEQKERDMRRFLGNQDSSRDNNSKAEHTDDALLQEHTRHHYGSCPSLLHCVGYQACLFRFSNEFCLQDPFPGL